MNGIRLFCARAGFVAIGAVMTAVLASGCASAGASMYADRDALSRFGATGVVIDAVSVTLDYVPQRDIASQMAAFAGSSLNAIDSAGAVGAERAAVASIDVNQRSFFSGIDPVNSIFVSLTASDETGKVLFRVTRYRVGKDSVLSAAVQRDLMRDITAPAKGLFARGPLRREIDAP